MYPSTSLYRPNNILGNPRILNDLPQYRPQYYPNNLMNLEMIVDTKQNWSQTSDT